MNLKRLTLAAGFALSALSSNVHAKVETWTIAITGNIWSGTDYSGVFGTVNQNLHGLTYTQTITASIDRADWSRWETDTFYHRLTGTGPAFTTTMTVNGHTTTYHAISTQNGTQEIGNGATIGYQRQPYDYIYSSNDGSLGGNASIWVYAHVQSKKPFLPTLNFDRSIRLDTKGRYPGDTSVWSTSQYFSVHIPGGDRVRIEGFIDHIDLNMAPVPEPSTYAMLLAGVGLLGFAARRKRNAA